MGHMGDARRRQLIADKAPPKPTRDVAIGYCRPENVDGMFFDSVTGMLLYDSQNNRRIGAMIGAEGGARVHLARNEIVRRFRGTDCAWLAWIDGDMVVPVDFVDALLAVADPVEKPIVGALCFSGGTTTIKPTIYRIYRDDQGQLKSECAIYYPTPALLEVDGTGSACILIHRSVFDAIEAEPSFGSSPHPWYVDQVIDGFDFSEDLVFCMRAKAVGKKIFVHTGVKVGHRKKRVLDEDVFISFIARATEQNPDVMCAPVGTVDDVTIEPSAFEGMQVRV